MSADDKLWLVCLAGSYFVHQLDMNIEQETGREHYYLPPDQPFMNGYLEGLRTARFLWRCASEGEGAALYHLVGELNRAATRPPDTEGK